MIHDPDRVVQTPAAVLRTVLGLTPREAELAVALCAGSEPSGFAAAAGVSTNTVRFHLKSIYAKTGARGQADLIRRISATLASLGRVGAAPAGRGRQP
jgi:DNA-binding CsgD family transcriptional regulator